MRKRSTTNQTASKPIRVLVAEDRRQVRIALRTLLQVEEGVKLVAEARTARETLRLIGRHHPDVVVMDVTTPRPMGLDVAARAMKKFPDIPLIVLSANPNARRVRQAVRAGAAGYLIKDATARLTSAVRAVARGETYFSPVAAQFLWRPGANATSRARVPLTPRQREVLRLIADGYSNKQIAAVLNVSIKTVETHRARLMERLGIHEVAGLVRYAIRVGLTTAER